jgi:hypothetical protein
MTVNVAGATLEYDCASGTVDEPLSPDAHGRFEARGTFVPGKGGPVVEGEEPVRYPALHRGTTDDVLVGRGGQLLAGRDLHFERETLPWVSSPVRRKRMPSRPIPMVSSEGFIAVSLAMSASIE